MNPDIAAAIPRLVEAGALPPPVALPPLGKRKLPETREASLGKKEASRRRREASLGKKEAPRRRGKLPWEKGSFPETREASLGKKEAPGDKGSSPGKRKLPGDEGSFPWEKGSFPETREASLGKKEASRRQRKLPLGKRKLPETREASLGKREASRRRRKLPWQKEASRRRGKLPCEKGSFPETREASLGKKEAPERRGRLPLGKGIGGLRARPQGRLSRCRGGPGRKAAAVRRPAIRVDPQADPGAGYRLLSFASGCPPAERPAVPGTTEGRGRAGSSLGDEKRLRQRRIDYRRLAPGTCAA